MRKLPLSRRHFLKAGAGATGLFSLGFSPKLFAQNPSADLHARRIQALGTRVVVLVRHADARLAEAGIAAAINEILTVHDKMNIFAPSPVQNLSQRAQNNWAAVDDEQILQVLQHAEKVQQLSQGAFVAFKALNRRQNQDARLELDAKNARLHLQKSNLDLNGIAKGYAVDQARMALLAKGLQNFVVNAGGDLYAAGDASKDQAGWPIKLRAGANLQTFKTLRLRNQASATSGNQGRGPAANWQNVRHIFDPRRFQNAPAHAPLAACVVSNTAMHADALATALFVGQKDLAKLVQNEHNSHAWLVKKSQQIETIG